MLLLSTYTYRRERGLIPPLIINFGKAMIRLIAAGYLPRIILLPVAVLLLCACSAITSTETTPVPNVPVQDPARQGWWKVSYKIAWPLDEDPLWHMDVLLAHQVIAPVLKRHRPAIELWRVHRRAGRDSTGHRFSFLFYSSNDAAHRIVEDLQGSPVAKRLLSKKRLDRIDYITPQKSLKQNIEDTSDPVWPMMVQKTWPHFIMGVSEMWLGLVNEMAAQSDISAELDEDKRYRNIQEQLSTYWREEGQHPFLHHLNAIFGYQEMKVINRNGEKMRF